MKIHPPVVLGSVRFPIACSRTRLLTSVVVGLLASAANEGRAANTVFLNFDSGGANSFLSKINTAAGGAYFPAADVPAIETGIQNEINRVYGAFDVTTTTAPAAGARTETFADAPTQVVYGLAPYNWRNGFLATTNGPANAAAITAQIFPQYFGPSLSGAATVAQNEQRLEIAIGDTAAHELGHSFGLNHQDDYGDPGITPANYHATGGIQNTHIMASGVSGLSDDRSTPRNFGQLEIAKLAQGNLLPGFAPNLIADSGDTHTNLATAGANAAEPINFKYLPQANESVVTITGGNIGAAAVHDVYSFTASAGALLTADLIANVTKYDDEVPVGTTYFKNALSAIVTLYRDNGGSPQVVRNGALAVQSSDKQYAGNDWLSGSDVDGDPMILNQPLPATDTYYLDVQTNGGVAGNYEMFVAVPEPASLCLFATGSAFLLRRGKRSGLGQGPKS